MSRGEGAIRGKFRGILRGFNIRWATRLLRETPRADLFSVRAQRSSVGLLGQRQFFSHASAVGQAREGGKQRQGEPPCAPTSRCHRRARGNARSGEPPFAPTSRCHSVGEGLGVRAIQNAHPPHAANSTDVPLSCQSPSRSSQKTAVDNPLLKGPPAGRGNRTAARFPSRSGGNLKEGETSPYPLLRVPDAGRGNRTAARFPSRSGGNLKEGGNKPLPPPTGSRCRQGEPNRCAVPLAKRGEPHGRGQLCPLSPPLRRS